MIRETVFQRGNEYLLRARQCAERCGMGLSAWWRFVQLGIAPKPVKIGARFTAWRASDVLKFIEDIANETLGPKGGRT